MVVPIYLPATIFGGPASPTLRAMFAIISVAGVPGTTPRFADSLSEFTGLSIRSPQSYDFYSKSVQSNTSKGKVSQGNKVQRPSMPASQCPLPLESHTQFPVQMSYNNTAKCCPFDTLRSSLDTQGPQFLLGTSQVDSMCLT